ncbi:MAG: hypothetical protein ACXWDJ_09700 [Aeromicrobium sp.]
MLFAVVTDDDRGSLLVGLGAPHWLEIDEADVAASHQDWPSPAVPSHRVLSSLASPVATGSILRSADRAQGGAAWEGRADRATSWLSDERGDSRSCENRLSCHLLGVCDETFDE